MDIKTDIKMAPVITQDSILPSSIKQRHLVSSPTQKGDMYYGKDGNSFANLKIGTANQIITSIGGIPVWASQPCMVFSLGKSSAGNTGFGATRYGDTGGGNVVTESNAGNIMPLAGTLKNMWIQIDTNTLNSGNLVCTLFKNGVGTALTQTIAFGVNSITGDTTHSVTVAAGDRITIQTIAGGTGGSVDMSFSYILYQ